MISDITKSIKINLYERISSPLFGSFAISWALWNYQTILIITSSLKVKDKIEYIEKTLYPNYYDIILQGFLYPLLMAVVFLLLYPIPSRWIYKYWHTAQQKLKSIKQKIRLATKLLEWIFFY